MTTLMHRSFSSFVAALLATLCAATAGAPSAAEASAAAESGHRGEAIRRYESLLAENNPALAGRRDEFLFRLGLLYLEDAQAGSAAGGGGSYGSRQRYEQAISLFEQTLAKPGTIFREEALYFQGVAFEETGNAEAAQKSFRTLIREFPSSAHAAEVWFRIGNDAVQKNKLSEALSAYESVLRFGEPRYRDQASYMYAWCAFSLRQAGAARTTLFDLLQRLEAASPQGGNLYEEAVELLAKVIRAENDTAALSGPWMGARPRFASRVLRRTADLYRETSAFREAALAYQQLLRESPDLPDAEAVEKLVVECYARAADGPNAQEARERLIARLQSTSPSSEELPTLLKESALYLHKEARERQRPDLFQRAIAAYGAYREAVAQGAAHWDMAFFQAEAMKEYGDVGGAAEIYRQIAEARDAAHGEESAFRRIALLEDARGRGQVQLDDVLASYGDYFRLYPSGPHDAELRGRQAGYLFDDKRYAESLAAGADAVARTSDPAARQKLKLMLARAAFASNDFAQCANWANQLLAEPALTPEHRKDGQELHAAAILKSAEALKDQPAEAARQYDVFVRLYPQHPSAPGALYNGAVAFREAGDKGRAIQLFRELVDRYPQSEFFRDATVAANELYREGGNAIGAAELLEKAAAAGSSDVDSAALLYEAATSARDANATAKATELYEKFLKAYPGSDFRSATARIYVAKALAREGRADEAERMARDTIAHVPDGGTPDEIQKTQLILAESHLILGEASLRRFESIRLTEPVAKTLERKKAALEQALANLQEAARYGFADVSLASYYKIGWAQMDFADSVMEAPRPRKLSAEQRDQYDELLREQVRPYREGAEKAFRLTLEQARTAGVENEWTARARVALAPFGGDQPPSGAAPGGEMPVPAPAAAPASEAPPSSPSA